MKRIGGLFEQITPFQNLLLATRKAARGKQSKPTVARFLFYLEYELFRLESELNHNRYRPGDFTVFEIFDPKRRRICAAPFRDRVVHHAICNVLEPIFDRRLIFNSYACRTGKGTHAAIQRAQDFARCYAYCAKFDIRKFFESVDHVLLKELLRRILKEPQLLGLLDRIIDHPPPYSAPGKGLPIGNLTSQHFANFYLGELDHYLKDRLGIKGYIRYMDDMLLFGDDKPALHYLLADIRKFAQTRLQLQFKEQATLLVPVSEGIPFLGFRVYPEMIRLNQRTLRRLRCKFRGNERAYLNGKIDIDELIATGSALISHIAHADSFRLREHLICDSLIPG